MEQNKNHTLFSKEIIEFATVGVNFAATLEQARDLTAVEFVQHITKILPLLYVKTTLLPEYDYDVEEDYCQEYVTEDAYNFIFTRLSTLLGDYNTFLTSVHDDMQYSDTPIAANIAEYLSDVYQNVVNLLGVIREENELLIPAAVGKCRYYFQEYWGEHLLVALTALHRIEYNAEAIDALSDQEDIASEEVPSNTSLID